MATAPPLKTPPPVLSYATGSRLSFRNWIAIAFAALAVLHFSISSLFWITSALSNRSLRDTLGPAWPCAGLLAISMVSLLLAVKRSRSAGWVLCLLLLASAVGFWRDIIGRNYQLHVFIATTEYWEKGGKEHVYYTWWWYNDRWFRSAWPRNASRTQPGT